MSLLTLDQVTVTYPDGDREVTALNSVNLQVNAGEVVAVTGPSGSGKSTLLAVAGLLLAPSSGRVVVAGTEVTNLGRAEATRLRLSTIGLVFQQSNLIASLTAYEQLLMVAHLSGRPNKASKARARELLDAVGLAEVAGRRPHQLSGGQRQRVGIARAFMNNPSVLLVDEPTSALDQERGQQIVDLIVRVTTEQQAATVIVSHDLATLRDLDAQVSLRDGSVVSGTPSRL